jgi:hypothetical protein
MCPDNSFDESRRTVPADHALRRSHRGIAAQSKQHRPPSAGVTALAQIESRYAAELRHRVGRSRR